MRKRIAIIGQSKGALSDSVMSKVYEIGKHLAKEKCVVMSGGCRGYPHEAIRGCFDNDGITFAVSPARDQAEHTKKYEFPIDSFSTVAYTGSGIPKRNYELVNQADAVIMVAGKIGTLNEFTVAFSKKKPVAVLGDSGGVSSMVAEIEKVCSHPGEGNTIIFEKEPEQLVKKLLGKLK